MVVERAGAGVFLTPADLKTASVMDAVAASESCAPVPGGHMAKGCENLGGCRCRGSPAGRGGGRRTS